MKAEYVHCTIREVLFVYFHIDILISKKCIGFSCSKMFESHPLIHFSSHPVHFGWTRKPGFLKVEASVGYHAILLRIEELKKQVRFAGSVSTCRCDEHGDKCEIGFLLSFR